jgi:ATP:ADP antiporter, AAA family
MSQLRRLLDIRPEERRNTFAAFATLLAITSGHTLMETARDALFLAKLPASRLPWMYLAIVAGALLLAQVGRRWMQSRGGVALSLVVAAFVAAGFWAVAHNPTQIVLYALYVWSGVFASWVMVQFWTLLGRVHTMTQAKRLYGLIGAGAVLGAIMGALLARWAMSIYPPRTTLLLAAALFALAAGPCLAMRPQDDEPDDEINAGRPGAKRRRVVTTGLTLLWQNPFARRVLGIVLVSTVTVTLGDFLFKSLVASHIRDPRELGRYFSSFYAVTNTLALVAQLLVAPWVFRALGVQRGLFFFPALMLIAAGGVVVSGGVLLAAVVLKGLDGTLRHSVHRTGMELLLVPVPDGTRERIKPIVDLVGTRGGQALASVGVLLLVAVSAADPVTVGAVVLTLAVVWFALVITIRRLYLDVFRETLKAGGLTGKAELPELDLGALETLFAGLNSSRDIEVLASLELLAEQHRERLIPALILYHPSRGVVLRALDIFAQMGRSDFVSIADRLNGHADRDVAAAALRARTAVSPDRALLTERLADSCPQVSGTALIALMARGWIEEDEAAARLEAILAPRSWQTAAELARAVRDVAADAQGTHDTRFDDLLVRIAEMARDLHDIPCGVPDVEPAGGPPRVPMAPAAPADARVLIEVARAMGRRRNARFLPHLVAMLNRHELRVEARLAIQATPGALEALDLAMGAKELPRDVRVHLPRTISVFDPARAARVLLPYLVREREGAVRFKVLRGLLKIHRANPTVTLDSEIVMQAAEATLEHIDELRRWAAALESGDETPPVSERSADPLRAAHHLLLELVRDKEVHATERLFGLLELLHREDFEAIWRGLRSKNPKTRASSLELLENLVRSPLRARVLSLVGDGPEDSAPPAISYESAIVEMVERGGRTMRTLSEYRAAELGLDVSKAAHDREAGETELETSLGARLAQRARDLMSPTRAPGGATRAPA